MELCTTEEETKCSARKEGRKEGVSKYSRHVGWCLKRMITNTDRKANHRVYENEMNRKIFSFLQRHRRYRKGCLLVLTGYQ